MTISKALLIALVIILGMVVLLPLILRFATLNGSGVTGFSLGGSFQSPGTGLIISSDEGETWQSAGVAENRQPSFPSRIWGVFYHPQKPEIIFLGTKGDGIWKSVNGGKSWQKLEDKSKVLKPNSDVYKVAVSRSNPKIIYAAVYQDKFGRVLKSEDGGENFQEIYFVNSRNFGVFDLQLNPANPDQVLIATGQGGLLETQNGGRTWRVKHSFGSSLQRLLGEPFSFFDFYVISVDDKLYKTFDGGENWEDFTDNLKNDWNKVYNSQQPNAPGGVNALRQAFQPQGNNLKLALGTLTLDNLAPNILYVGLPSSLLRSYDGGVSWSEVDVPIPAGESPVSSVAVSPHSSALILVSAGNQIYKSVDNGVDWKIITVPVKKNIKTIYINPLKPAEMLAVLQ